MSETFSCQDLVEALGDYLDGQLPHDVRAALELHLSHCQACEVVVDSVKKTVKIVTERSTFELPADLSAKVMARIRDEVKES